MSFDEFVEAYGAVCDVVYRTGSGWPLDHDDDNPYSHTSDGAREAAARIFAILGIEMDAEGDERMAQHREKMGAYSEGHDATVPESPEVADHVLAKQGDTCDCCHEAVEDDDEFYLTGHGGAALCANCHAYMMQPHDDDEDQ